MDKPIIINLPKILDPRGNLSFFENSNQIPFDIKRTYWIYDVPGGEIRGSHAFKESHEFIIALSGSFDVVLNDGENGYKIIDVTAEVKELQANITANIERFKNVLGQNSAPKIDIGKHCEDPYKCSFWGYCHKGI